MDTVVAAITSEFPLIILLLLLTALRVAGHLDVVPWDETDYLRSGLAIASGTMVPWSDFPGHASIFSLASFFTDDSVAVYYIGRVLTSVLFVMSSWLAVRMISSRMAAFIVAALVAALATPYSSIGSGQTGAALLALGLMLILLNRSQAQSVAGSVVLWLATTARLEYLPAAIVGSVVVVWLSGQRARQNLSSQSASHRRRALLRLAASSTLVLIIPALMLIAPVPFDTGRLWLTFGQHYASGRVEATPISGVEWEPVLAKDFPGAHSFAQAAVASPGNFIAHVRRNLPRVPLRIISPGMVNPSASLAGLCIQILATVILLSLAAIPLISVGKMLMMSRRGITLAGPAGRWIVALPAFTAAATSIGILIIIYPETHYLSGWIQFIAIAAGLGLKRFAASRHLPKIYATVMLTVVVALAVNGIGRAVFPASRPVADVVSSIRSLPRGQRLLSGYWGLSVYCSSVSEICPTDSVDDSYRDFAEFVAGEQISVVMIDESLYLGQWSRLPGYKSFLEDPSSLGFSALGNGSPLWILDQ